MPFNVGPWELLLILGLLLIVFGAKRLPEMGAAMGKGIRQFKREITDVRSELDRPDEADPPARRLDASAVEAGDPKKLSE